MVRNRCATFLYTVFGFLTYSTVIATVGSTVCTSIPFACRLSWLDVALRRDSRYNCASEAAGSLLFIDLGTPKQFRPSWVSKFPRLGERVEWDWGVEQEMSWELTPGPSPTQSLRQPSRHAAVDRARCAWAPAIRSSHHTTDSSVKVRGVRRYVECWRSPLLGNMRISWL